MYSMCILVGHLSFQQQQQLVAVVEIISDFYFSMVLYFLHIFSYKGAITQVKVSEQRFCLLNKADHIENYRKNDTTYHLPVLERPNIDLKYRSEVNKSPDRIRSEKIKHIKRRPIMKLDKKINKRSHKKDRMKIFNFLKNSTKHQVLRILELNHQRNSEVELQLSKRLQMKETLYSDKYAPKVKNIKENGIVSQKRSEVEPIDAMTEYQRLKLRWRDWDNNEHDMPVWDTRRQDAIVPNTTKSASEEIKDLQEAMAKDEAVETTTYIFQKYTTRTTTESVRTTIKRLWLDDYCDYLAYYCMKAYVTGRVCARTAHWLYYTFKNYCMMDYVNCVERFDVWHPMHMGPCFNVGDWTDFNEYEPAEAKYLYYDLASPALHEAQFGLRPTD